MLGPVGTMVDITGTNLDTTTDVRFGNVSVNAVTVVSSAAIRVSVPSGAVTGRLTITNPAGSTQSSASFTAVPRIDAFGAPSGSPDTELTLLGSSFTGVTSVKFGAVSASFSIDSDSQLTAVVPATAVTGRVSVTSPGGTATSPASFVVLAPTLTQAIAP
jgi:hypothetical protein